ncbi:MAG: four helix bundle protein [Candidatus Marinimicrobia bacterium]|nr:four helix bundle protein [Candidatus Neomarinimicrobiota bacterium]
MTKQDLEDRLIAFSSSIIEITESMSQTYAGNHLSNQLLRSGTSVALNYGEAQGAESRKDFLHKIKVILKELRETMICLKLIKNKHLINTSFMIDKVVIENNELISIFVKSIQTAQKNDLKRKE